MIFFIDPQPSFKVEKKKKQQQQKKKTITIKHKF